jgi:hypothetical protein
MQKLEANATRLSGEVARLKRALRTTMRHAFPVSDKGTASWYQEAWRALGSSDDV